VNDLYPGDIRTVFVNAYKVDGTIDDYFAFSSSNSTATVAWNANELTITGVTVGPATITVQSISGISKTITVTVLPPSQQPVLSLSKYSIEGLAAGTIGTVIVTAKNNLGMVENFSSWSENTAVATVNINGNYLYITAVAQGSTWVAITSDSGLNANVWVTVVPQMTGEPVLSLSRTLITELFPNTPPVPALVYVTALNNLGVPEGFSAWSNDGSIASVTQNGSELYVYGWKAGTTTINVFSNSALSATISVAVSPSGGFYVEVR
jgi:hypothetical protein